MYTCVYFRLSPDRAVPPANANRLRLQQLVTSPIVGIRCVFVAYCSCGSMTFIEAFQSSLTMFSEQINIYHHSVMSFQDWPLGMENHSNLRSQDQIGNTYK